MSLKDPDTFLRDNASPKQAVSYVKDNEAKIVDIRFTDLFGAWHHFSIPAIDLTEDIFEEGIGFDGSSIRGFQAINESDMLLVPDASSLFMDPFTDAATAVVICDIEDPITRQRYTRDPRFVASKAEPLDSRLIGMHGALTQAELRIPLIVVPPR